MNWADSYSTRVIPFASLRIEPSWYCSNLVYFLPFSSCPHRASRNTSTGTHSLFTHPFIYLFTHYKVYRSIVKPSNSPFFLCLFFWGKGSCKKRCQRTREEGVCTGCCVYCMICYCGSKEREQQKNGQPDPPFPTSFPPLTSSSLSFALPSSNKQLASSLRNKQPSPPRTEKKTLSRILE